MVIAQGIREATVAVKVSQYHISRHGSRSISEIGIGIGARALSNLAPQHTVQAL